MNVRLQTQLFVSYISSFSAHSYGYELSNEPKSDLKLLAIRIQDKILEELNEHSRNLHIPRSEYIRQAVIVMNKQVDRELRRKRIMEASRRIRAESMRVNAEFDSIEDAPNV
ncbi:MAG: ribbon-helix-helix domain-containing protein [Desulfuromusa sp.]|nr:ribbon-helix-helix domain-containing protein [Desulfuromusa sp.]